MGWPWPRDADARLDQILAWCCTIDTVLLAFKHEVKAMSDTLAAELAAERAALDNLKVGVAVVAQRVSDLAAQLAAAMLVSGGAPTADQLAEMAADAAEIQAAADVLKAAAAPGPAFAEVATPAAEA